MRKCGASVRAPIPATILLALTTGLMIAACSSDSGGQSSAPSSGLLAGAWRLDSARVNEPDGTLTFQVVPDEHWGYVFDGTLNGDPANVPATGILTVKI